MRISAAPLLAGVMVFVPACGGDASEEDVREMDATLACQDWVREQLRAPSTADFTDAYVLEGRSDVTEEDVYAGRVDENVYTVRGSVDAENGFGATLQTAWTCEVEDTGDGWRLIGLDVAG